MISVKNVNLKKENPPGNKISQNCVELIGMEKTVTDLISERLNHLKALLSLNNDGFEGKLIRRHTNLIIGK